MRVVKHDKRKDGIGDDNRLEGVRLKVKNKENSAFKFVVYQQPKTILKHQEWLNCFIVN